MDCNKLNVLLSTAYLAPVQYFTKLVSYPNIFIEYCESYLKQSYRNRTIILSANGPLHLTIPVADGPRARGPVRDLRISQDVNWQQIHWRGIWSSYNNSPFFEYYADELAPFFHEKKWQFLIDFNQELQTTILKAMNADVTLLKTTEYFRAGEVPGATDDFRYTIHPKPQKQTGDPHFYQEAYVQVFDDKWGFVPNLSIVDLLFNEGPGTLAHLRSCLR